MSFLLDTNTLSTHFSHIIDWNLTLSNRLRGRDGLLLAPSWAVLPLRIWMKNQ